MYSEETQNYELVTLSEIKFAEGTPHCYYGKSYLKIGDTVKYSIKGNEDSDSGRKNVRDGKIISITDFIIAIKNENGYVECVNRSAINTETFAHKIRKVR